MQEEIQEEFHQKEVDIQNEFNKNLLQKNEENSRLKNLNQGLTEQIKQLKNEKLEKSLELLSTSESRNHKQLKFLQGFHKRLECLTVTQITEVDTTNIKVNQKINIVFLIDKPTTTLKMNKKNTDNFYGSLN